MAKRHPALIALSHDHHHALALALSCRKHALGQIRPGDATAVQEQAARVQAFFQESLVPHFAAEEKILFPLMLAESPGAKTMVDGLLREHERLRRDVASLDGKASLQRALFDLGDLLESHVRTEERELFALFERTVPPSLAEKAGREIEKILASSPARSG